MSVLARIDAALPRYLRDLRFAAAPVVLVLVLAAASLAVVGSGGTEVEHRAEGVAPAAEPEPVQPPSAPPAPAATADDGANLGAGGDPDPGAETHSGATQAGSDEAPPVDPAATPAEGPETEPAVADEEAGGPEAPPATQLPPPPGAPPGRGVTDSTILIGMNWVDPTSIGPGFAAVGLPGPSDDYDFGNIKRQGDLVVEHINAHGGMAERQVEQVWFETRFAGDFTDSSKATMAQEMCATFTEDHQVFAMTMATGGHPGQISCAVNTETPIVSSHFSQIVDEERFADGREYIYLPGNMLLGRRDRAYVEGLATQGFFDATARVGLLTQDHPEVRRSVEKSLKPALADAGVTVVSEALYIEGFHSPWPNYVLQFQTAGVTHVLFSASNVFYLAPLFFMRAAENQLYRPRYGLATTENALGLVGVAPADQLRQVQGVGWYPSGDVGGDAALELLESSPAETCREIMRQNGEPEFGVGLIYCELLFFLKAGLDRSPELTPAGLAAGVASLEETHTSLFTLRTRFGSLHHDGASAVRDFAYDDGCGCLVYTSALRHLAF